MEKETDAIKLFYLKQRENLKSTSGREMRILLSARRSMKNEKEKNKDIVQVYLEKIFREFELKNLEDIYDGEIRRELYAYGQPWEGTAEEVRVRFKTFIENGGGPLVPARQQNIKERNRFFRTVTGLIEHKPVIQLESASLLFQEELEKKCALKRISDRVEVLADALNVNLRRTGILGLNPEILKNQEILLTAQEELEKAEKKNHIECLCNKKRTSNMIKCCSLLCPIGYFHRECMEMCVECVESTPVDWRCPFCFM